LGVETKFNNLIAYGLSFNCLGFSKFDVNVNKIF
jgi:hypothetical protein